MLDFLKMVFNREKFIIVLKYHVLKLAIENAILTGKLNRGDTVSPLAQELVEMTKAHETEIEKTRALQVQYQEATTKANELIDYVTNMFKAYGIDIDNL